MPGAGGGWPRPGEAAPCVPHRLSATPPPALLPGGPCSKADGDPRAWCVWGGQGGRFQTSPAGFWQGLPSRRAWILSPPLPGDRRHRLSNLQGLLLEVELTSFSGLPLGSESLIPSHLLPGGESGTGWGLRPWLPRARWASTEVGGGCRAGREAPSLCAGVSGAPAAWLPTTSPHPHPQGCQSCQGLRSCGRISAARARCRGAREACLFLQPSVKLREEEARRCKYIRRPANVFK